MIHLQLTRKQSTNQGTFGVLSSSGGFLAYTAELPWKDNKPRVSCIPPGVYKGEPWNTRKFPNTYHVMDVPGRTAILMHQGNLSGDVALGYYSHVLGCIALGDKMGMIHNQMAVLLSVVAMRHLRAFLGHNNFELEII